MIKKFLNLIKKLVFLNICYGCGKRRKTEYINACEDSKGLIKVNICLDCINWMKKNKYD